MNDLANVQLHSAHVVANSVATIAPSSTSQLAFIAYRVTKGAIVIRDEHRQETSTLSELQEDLILPISSSKAGAHRVYSSTPTASIIYAILTPGYGSETVAAQHEGLQVAARESVHQAVEEVHADLKTALIAYGEVFYDDVIRDDALKVVKSEKEFRFHSVMSEEIFRREVLMRRYVENQQEILFHAIVHERKEEALVPWCTMQCRYCCMTRLEWHRHVTNQYELLRISHENSEAMVRNALVNSEDSEFRRITSTFSVSQHIHDAHEGQRSALVSQENSNRAEVSFLEKEEGVKLVAQFEEICRMVKAANDANQLREKHVAVLNLQDSLTLQEKRLHRQLQFQVVETERSRRSQMTALEEIRRAEQRVSMETARNDIMSVKWKSEMKHVFDERDSLAEYKNRRDAEDEEKRIAKEKAILQDLEDELKAIKKLKKTGPPKNEPPPLCPRCHEAAAKDMYTHRMAECPERPTQCTKCSEIMPLSVFEPHKGICPARVVQCSSCNNHYKASYLERSHEINCDTIQDIRKTLGELKPKLPFALQQPDGSLMDVLAPEHKGTEQELNVDENPGSNEPGMISPSSSQGSLPLVILIPSGRDIPLEIESDTVPPSVEGTAVPTSIAPSSFVGTPLQLISILGHNVSSMTDVRALFDGEQPLVPLVLDAPMTLQVMNPSELQQTQSADQREAVKTVCTLKTVMGTSISWKEYTEMKKVIQSDEEQYCKPQPVPKGKKK